MYLFILSGKYLTSLFLSFSTRSTFSTKKRSHRTETLKKTHKIRLTRFSLFECTLLDPDLQHTEELIDLFYFITFWSHYYYTDPLCIKKTIINPFVLHIKKSHAYLNQIWHICTCYRSF